MHIACDDHFPGLLLEKSNETGWIGPPRV